MSNIFRAYDVRGIYPEELNEDAAFKIGRAAALYLKAKNLVVGEDARISSPALSAKLKEGIISTGCDVLSIGLCTTPLFYFAVDKLNADGGIMITASHNPPEYNGFKTVGPRSISISSESGLLEIKNLLDKVINTGKIGQIKNTEVLSGYIDRVAEKAGKFENNLKLVIDAGNGTTSLVLGPLLEKLNIRYIPLYFEIDGNFPNHFPDISKEESLKFLKEKISSEKADLGVAFDGDGDRITFVDKNGVTIKADYILALLFKSSSRFFMKPKVVYDSRFTKSVKDLFGRNGIRSRVGYAFIKPLMRKVGAGFGGEMSGHFFMKEMNYSESAVLTMLKILKILNESGKSIEESVKPWQKYFDSREISLKVENREGSIANLKSKYNNGKLEELNGLTVEYPNWWFNIRPSNTEPLLRLVVEADTQKLLDQKVSELVSEIKKAPYLERG